MDGTDVTTPAVNMSNPVRDPPLDACDRVQDFGFVNDYSNWIWITRISFPIFLITCTIGNSVGILIAWKDIKGAKRSFLLFIFVTNLCFMWNKFFLLLGGGIWTPPDPNELYGQIYLQSAGYWMYMDAVFYSATQWAILSFCLERYLALTDPLRHYVGKRRIGVVGIIAIVFLICIVSSLYAPVVYYTQLANSKVKLGILQPLPEAILRWRKFDVWLEFAVRIVTYISIVVLDLLIVFSLHKHERQSVSSLNASGLSTTSDQVLTSSRKSLDRALEIGTRRLRASRSATKTLILSSIFFLVSQSLEIVMQILVILNNPPICSYQITMKFLLIYGPVQLLFTTSYFAGGFFVYISPLQCWRTRTRLVKRQLDPGRSVATSVNGSTSVLTGTSSC